MAGVLVGWAAFLPAVSLGPDAVYAQDGAWIHLSVAEHWLDDGVWGVSAAHGAAASSSPSWTVLVALTLGLTELDDLTPYMLQAPLLVALTLLVARWLEPLPAVARTLLSLTTVTLMGLPALLLTSMEHALHALVALAAVEATARHLEPSPRRGALIALALASALAVTTRPESLFLLLGTGAALAAARRWSALAAGHGTATLAALAMGAWFIRTGVGPLPNAVYAKSALKPAGSFPSTVASAVADIPAHLGTHEPMLLVTMLLLVATSWVVAPATDDPRVRVGQWALLAAVAGQLAFARLGSLARYEGWLVVLALSVILRAWALGGRTPATTRVMLAATTVLLCTRVVQSTQASLLALGAMAGGELAASEVLASSFTGDTVVSDEVGAISFHARVDVLDPLGLADNAVLRLRRSGGWDADALDRTARSRGAALAVLHLDRPAMHGLVPSSWTPVAVWEVPDGPDLTWFAVDAPAVRVKEALERRPPPRTTVVRWR